MTERNHLIDFARVISMVIVVTFHSLLYFITDTDGNLSVSPWAPGPILWVLSWGLAIIPIFFVTAGYASAVSFTQVEARKQNYYHYLATRISRILGPLTLFSVFFVVISSIPVWLGSDTQAIELSRQFAMLMWFLVVYLALQAAAPLLIAAFDRFRMLSMLPFLIGALCVDIVSRESGNAEITWLNLAFVWPIAHQWGIAYQRGWFRSWRIRYLILLVLASIGIISMLVFCFGYPPAAVAWADVLVANLLPPTLAALVMGFMQTCVLGVLERLGVAHRLSAPTAARLRIANALALSIYLWHIPMIVISAGILGAIALLWPATAPIVLSQIAWVLLAWVLVATVIPAIARVEVRLIPKMDGETRPTQTIIGFTLLFFGVFLIWKTGAVISPQSLGSTSAVLLLFTGIGVCRHLSSGGTEEPQALQMNS